MNSSQLVFIKWIMEITKSNKCLCFCIGRVAFPGSHNPVKTVSSGV